MEDEVNVTPTLEEETKEETGEEETEKVDWEAEAKKAKELAENYKRRAEKAEKKSKEITAETVITNTSLNQNDLLYLAKVDIHEDDLEELTNIMQKMSMTAKQAHEFLTPRFAIKSEERKTAAATNTGSARGVKAKTGEDYLRKAQESGEVPTDNRAMQELILARQNRLRIKK